MEITRDFKKGIQGKSRISVIAEVKKRSPTGYDFKRYTVPQLVSAYERGNSSAISVVTDPHRFGGSLALLEEVRELTGLPVLRKDFIHKPEQVDDGWYAGADATLLIAKDHSKKALNVLIDHVRSRTMDALVEIHDPADLAKIADRDDIIIGINNRNLDSLRTDFRHALHVLDQVNPARVIVAESGFSHAGQLQQYVGRVDAALIGSSLLTSEDPLEKLKSFLT